MTRNTIAAAAAAAMLACILAANYVTTEYGMVWVFGLTATAGTYFAGATFVARDTVQDCAGKVAALAVIALGAGLSFLVADPFIALASAVAFGCSEVADLLVYTPLRRRGYVRAAVASNVVGSLVDTLLFLWIAGFGITGEVVAGQVVGKLAVTGLVILAVAAARSRRELCSEWAAAGGVYRRNADLVRAAIDGPPEVSCTACDYGYPASACSASCNCGSC